MAYLLRLFIDNLKATELEKIMMTNFKRFQIELTKYILIGAGTGTISYIYLSNFTNFKDKGFTDITELEKMLILIVIFSIAVSGVFVTERLAAMFFNLLSHRYVYYIVDDQNKPVSRVIKLSNKNQLLVDSDGVKEFIEHPMKKRYKEVRLESDFLSKLYGSRIIYVVLPCVFLVCIALLLAGFKTNSWIQFFLYLLFICSLLLFIALLFNFIFERKANKQQEQEGQEGQEQQEQQEQQVERP